MAVFLPNVGLSPKLAIPFFSLPLFLPDKNITFTAYTPNLG